MTSCNVYQVLLTNGTILRRFGRPTEPDFYFEAITSSTSYVHVISYGCYSNILRVDNYHPSDNTWNDSSIECKFDTNHQGGAAIVFGNSLFYLGYPSYKYNLKDHQWNELHAQVYYFKCICFYKNINNLNSFSGDYQWTACNKSDDKE